MLKRIALFLTVGLIAAVVLAACGGGSGDNGESSDGGSSGDGNTVSLELSEFKFTPNTFTVKAGSEVTINLKNTGSVAHDITIDDVNGQKVYKKVEAGKSDKVTFTAPSQAGTIDFYCAEPGHKESGMTGTMTVE